MTHIEAMKLALKALEYASTGNRRPELITPAIIDLRQAIAEAEQAQPVTTMREVKFGGCPFCGSQICVAGECQRPGLALKLAMAEENDKRLAALKAEQAQQEPVTGCVCRWNSEGDRVVTCERHQGWLEVVAEWADRAREAEKKLKALNTPPQPAQPQQGPVGEVKRYGRDSHGRQWHGIYWYDPNVDIPHGTKLYTSPPAQRKPLTDEQEYEAIGTAGVDLLELAKQWADNEIHVYQFDNEARKIIKAVLRRAHGIKGET